MGGFIISGGLLPNVNKGANSLPLPSPVPPRSLSSAPQPLQGDVHGYVGGPGGLPAIGATVVAAEQQSGYTVNSIVSTTTSLIYHQENIFRGFRSGKSLL